MRIIIVSVFVILLIPRFGQASYFEQCFLDGEVVSDPTTSPKNVQFKFRVESVKKLFASYTDCTYLKGKILDVVISVANYHDVIREKAGVKLVPNDQAKGSEIISMGSNLSLHKSVSQGFTLEGGVASSTKFSITKEVPPICSPTTGPICRP
jgi:hypothetical protein